MPNQFALSNDNLTHIKRGQRKTYCINDKLPKRTEKISIFWQISDSNRTNSVIK